MDEAASAGTLPAAKEEEFPSLGAAVAQGGAAKAKKGKAQKVALADFLTAPSTGSYQVGQKKERSARFGGLFCPSLSPSRSLSLPHTLFPFILCSSSLELVHEALSNMPPTNHFLFE